MSPKEEMDNWDIKYCRWLIIITAIISFPLGFFVDFIIPAGLWTGIAIGMFAAYGKEVLGVFNKR